MSEHIRIRICNCFRVPGNIYIPGPVRGLEVKALLSPLFIRYVSVLCFVLLFAPSQGARDCRLKDLAERGETETGTQNYAFRGLPGQIGGASASVFNVGVKIFHNFVDMFPRFGYICDAT